jgi:hypothetical protein
MQVVPVTPDRTVQKGTQRGREAGNLHPYSSLTFKSRDDPEGLSDPETHIEDLLLRLRSVKDALRSYSQRTRSDIPSFGTTVYMRLKIESTDREFGFGISDDKLRAISDLGAHLGVEVEIDEIGLDE